MLKYLMLNIQNDLNCGRKVPMAHSKKLSLKKTTTDIQVFKELIYSLSVIFIWHSSPTVAKTTSTW